jgi:heterodisulfide reductase subunit C
MDKMGKIDLSAKELQEEVEALSGQRVFACYHCGKCTAGCPFASEMDLTPRQVLEYIMEGRVGVLNSRTIWLCAACFTCTVRCPNGIDIARVMEALRQILLRRGEDSLDLASLGEEELPQIALVAGARKLIG